MRYDEFANNTKRVLDIQPSAVKQQARVAKVVQQIAASDEKQQPTEMDKVMATRQMAAMKKQADKKYVQQLKQQLRLAATG